MTWRARNVLAIVAIVASGGCAAVNDTPANGPSGPLVNCYNPPLNQITRGFANDCRGTIISDEEAARLGGKAYHPRNTPSRREYRLGDPRRDLVSTGSGFFVNAEGGLVTSFHVVENCSLVSVSPAVGGSQIGTLVAADALHDLALVRVPSHPEGIAVIARRPDYRPDGTVAVIGYPRRHGVNRAPSAFTARILGTKNAAPGLRVFGFRGPVQHGNSGGPVIDPSGHLVGVVFAKIAPTLTQTNGDIGFAIPSAAVTAFLSQHGASYTLAPEPAEAPPADILAAIVPAVAKVGCWN